jgi:hypothetical protein
MRQGAMMKSHRRAPLGDQPRGDAITLARTPFGDLSQGTHQLFSEESRARTLWENRYQGQRGEKTGRGRAGIFLIIGRRVFGMMGRNGTVRRLQ